MVAPLGVARLFYRALLALLMGALATASARELEDSSAAQKAVRDGDYPLAESLYRDILRAHPASPEILEALGLVLNLEGKTQQSAQLMLQALARKETPTAVSVLGADYCRMRDYDKAAPVLERATRYFDRNEVVNLLAPCYLEAGEPIYAVLAYQKLSGERPSDDGDSAANLVRACWRASRAYRQALKTQPGSGPYQAALARAAETGSADARGAIPEALRAAPYLTSNRSVASLASLLPAHMQDPALFYVMAVTCGELGIRSFQFLEDHYPDSVAARSLHAELLVSQHDLPAAVAQYEQLVRLEPRRIDLRHNLAVLYLRQGEWERALAEYRIEKQNSRGDLRAIAGISECLLYLGRYQEDLVELSALAGSQDNPEWVLLDLGSAHEHLGHIEEAIHAYEQAEKRNPMNRTTHYHLMRLYQKNGRDELAKKEAVSIENISRRAPSKTVGPSK